MQAQGAPQNRKIRSRIIRVLRINSVLYRMGRLRSPYDPSLIYGVNTVFLAGKSPDIQSHSV